jgi:3-deoxy-D-manno-octulosonic-acid transferase
MFLAKPFVRPALWLRRRRGLESSDPPRMEERFGVASVIRPKGRIFWFNASSVGEANSIVPVVERVLARYKDVYALVTTTTLTGAEVMSKKLKDKRAIHQFLPVDRGAYVKRFLDYWKPSAGFFVDSDFWPNLMLSSARRGVPLVLLNGRISDRSYRRWMKNRNVSAKLLSTFIYLFAKSDEDKKKLLGMGAKVVVCVGNLKYGVPPLEYDEKVLGALEKSLGGRKAWVAASTHEGEEALLEISHRVVRAAHPDALLIIAPRHPARGVEIAKMFEERGYSVAVRSTGQKITSETAVYIADTLGELGLFFKLAPVAFVGGSLLPNLAGHNPFEPAKLGDAVLSGMFVSSFAETYDIMKAEDAVIMVEDETELGNDVARLFSEPEELAGYAMRAKKIADRESGVLDRVMERLEPILDAV